MARAVPAPTQLHRLFFQDEAPQMGSGLRFVLAKRGRKWVYLLSPYTAKSCRLLTTVWDRISVNTRIDDDALLKRINAHLQTAIHHANREPTALEKRALGGKDHVA